MDSQDRASVAWNERAQRWRWCLVVDGDKTTLGWEDAREAAEVALREAMNPRPVHIRRRGPRSRWGSVS